MELGRTGVHFPSLVIPKDFKNNIHSFPVWLSANRGSVENKPASLLLVSLGKTLYGIPPSLCGRQMVRPSSLPVVVAQI